MISKSLGFEGMGCIHPRQIAVIKNGFAPEEHEIESRKTSYSPMSQQDAWGLE